VTDSASWVRIQRWCRCGDHLDARSSPPAAAIALDEQFGELHQGEGHGPTDARGARNARRRAARTAVSAPAPTTDTAQEGT
jgi:hypothetical protein